MKNLKISKATTYQDAGDGTEYLREEIQFNMELSENEAYDFAGKWEIHIHHQGISSFKSQGLHRHQTGNDWFEIRHVADMIKDDLRARALSGGFPVEKHTGFIPYNNFECSVKWEADLIPRSLTWSATPQSNQ